MKQSAGILLCKIVHDQLHVLLVHPGGPFWKNKDQGAWTIPKGEPDKGEELLAAARREFFEETGVEVTGECLPLKPVTQKGGKRVHAWAVPQDLDVVKIHSNTFEMEWPPRSGKRQSFPEIDRAQWFSVEEAMTKILEAQQALVKEAEEIFKGYCKRNNF